MKRFVLVIMTLMFAVPLSANEIHEKFSLKIYPLLKDKCFGCHGDKEKKQKGDFDMKSIEAILKGGDSGEPGLVKGNADASLIYKSIQWLDEDLEMPPKENDRLTEEQIVLVKEWINAGAPWVSEEGRQKFLDAEKLKEVTEDGVLVKHSGGLDDSWTYRRYQPEDIWAYQPLKARAVPQGLNTVDYFIHSKLKEANMSQATKADKLTLLRRVTYDLTGLPPTITEINQFINDNSEDAWEKLVDRLLASEKYGEQWGQRWLDVTRYSDTSGFSNDWEKSNAWRYRDYVIRSLNNDKPINQFFLEQVAGDEWKPNDPEMAIATGFLRMGPHGTAMVPDPESRQQYLDDVTNSVGETFMATPLKCASCHDHKFDPIPTKDYYSIQAVFATTHPGEMPARFLKEENRNRFKEGKEVIQRRLNEARKDVTAFKKKEEKAARKWMADRGLEYKSRMQLQDAPEDKKPPRFIGLTVPDQGYLKVREQDVRMYTRMLERYKPMAQSVYSGGYHVVNEKKLRPPKNLKKLKVPETHILTGGSLEAKGSKVSPGVLSAVATTTSYKMKDDMSGRRLAFAKWLSSDENALVIRTFVNRVWQGHFGKGIAANPNNLGKTGAKPTHPELLDALSIYFRDNN
ncbi:MAG: PSD1 and planctomycete cytochrome C domain-containing protein, partial [Lentisphaeraceae bacterium]|nr:PSD1 and planctomycete cytochrome C domain-containing protein [Lentisphaeraceae bacterium]